MNKKDTQSQLIDYLYGEMTELQKIEFEKRLESEPELQREMNELQQTRNLLREEQLEIPTRDLLMIHPGASQSDDGQPEPKGTGSQTGWLSMRTLLLAAAVLLLGIMTLSFVNLRIEQTDNSLVLSFGEISSAATTTSPPENLVTEEELIALMSQLQEENNRVFSTALEETRQEHQQQMEDVIQALTTYYDQRRQQDLVLISEGLSQLEEETYYRFLQTEEALEDLIFALSYQQSEQ